MKRKIMLINYLKNISAPKSFVFVILFFTSVISFAQSSSQTYWWNDAVFYEVFVRSFKDSDGDGNGDLKGLIEKLDYLNDGDSSTHDDLGVTGLWLMPIQQSPSYHGYDVTDYKTVEQDYGTNADFQNLMTEAHKRGIKVIVDFVMNHTSSQHPWFQSSIDPLSNKRGWYVWQSSNPGGTGPWGQQVWYSKNGNYYYAIFWSEMPDLNYTTQAVKDTMFDAARYWLEDMGADGFRLDAARYIIESGSTLEDTPETIQFWEDFRSYYKSVKSDAFAVGEAWASTDIAQQYVNNNGLDYCFEFDLASSIVNTANTGSISGLQSQVDKVMTSYPFLQFGSFLTNHDMNRVMDQLGGSTPKAKLAADLLMTLPGIPYMYYGEEIGMRGSGADENKRRPMQWNSTSQAGFTIGTPWEAVYSDYSVRNVESQQQDTTSLLYHYRNLIAIHNNQSALRRGNYLAVTASASSVFSFLRQYSAENMIIVSNTGSSDLSNVSLSLSNGGIAQGSYVLVELQSGNQIPLVIDNTGSFSNLAIGQIPARTTYIYKLMDASKTTTTVTFEVDMNALITNGSFNPATETVDIVAGFNGFGGDSISDLYDKDGDGIYTTTISGLGIGSTIDYKYRINGVNDGRQEFANSSYLRKYLVQEGENKVKDIYQTTSVSGISNSIDNAIAVYPIPANKEIFIEVSEGFVGTINYQLSDLSGKERISSSFESSIGQYMIECDELPEGVYLLSLTNNGLKKVFRIVVQK